MGDVATAQKWNLMFMVSPTGDLQVSVSQLSGRRLASRMVVSKAVAARLLVCIHIRECR